MANKFDKIRVNMMESVTRLFQDSGEDVLVTGSNELCLPIVDEDGEEGFLVMTFKIPKGSRTGDIYDGYEMAKEYMLKCRWKAEKAEEAQRKKKAKMEHDAEMRRRKAEAKLKRVEG